jgi:hypothetical protein
MGTDMTIEDKQPLEDNLSIDDLLDAALAKTKPMRSQIKSTQGYHPIEYVESPATIYCTTCQIQYDGSMTHVKDMDNLYDRYKTTWCPNCIKEQAVLWWEHCFRMKNVVQKPF